VHTAPTANFYDVNNTYYTYYNSWVDGDTLLIPAGNVIWDSTSTLIVDKAINISGAGTNSLTINAKTTGTLTGLPQNGFILMAVAAPQLCTVSGITFDGKGYTSGNGAMVLVGLGRLTSCVFKNFGSGGFALHAYNFVGGVIDHCVFKNYNAGINFSNW